MAVKPIPDGYHTVTPYLIVQGADKLIDFLNRAFNATESDRVNRPDGGIMHSQVKIGDSIVMISDACSEGGFHPMPTMIHLYVNDADTTYKRALLAGATSIMEPVDEFYGDRAAGVKDPTGNHWWIATHQEDVSSEELYRRVEALHNK